MFFCRNLSSTLLVKFYEGRGLHLLLQICMLSYTSHQPHCTRSTADSMTAPRTISVFYLSTCCWLDNSVHHIHYSLLDQQMTARNYTPHIRSLLINSCRQKTPCITLYYVSSRQHDKSTDHWHNSPLGQHLAAQQLHTPHQPYTTRANADTMTIPHTTSATLY